MKLLGRVYDVSAPLFEKLELSFPLVSHFKFELCSSILYESLYIVSCGTRIFTVSNHMSYGVSRGECARLRENVPYVKVHRYN